MMERENKKNITIIIALILAVTGLTIGFAAYSTSLNITSDADVKLDADTWKVGFSIDDDAITQGSVTGTLTGALSGDARGTLNLSQFVISQTNNAVLHTTNGSKVEYDFYIVNAGDLDAYLNTITVGTLSCAYITGQSTTIDNGHTTITPGTLNDEISSADCATMFTVTLDIGSGTITKTNGQTQTSGFGNANKLPKKSGTTLSYVPIKLSIAYNSNSYGTLANAPLGDFTVSLSDSTIIYGTSSN